ncbi:MAG: glycosyltransferase family 4 protein [Candidatus Limnocylindria bacterium]
MWSGILWTMRLVIHDFGGYAFSAQLARTLAARGHDVAYLHAVGLKAPRAALSRRSDDPSTLRVEGVRVASVYRSAAGVRRLLQERQYGRNLAMAIAESSPDAVISANCPLDAQRHALRAAHRSGAGFAFWLQDLYSVAVMGLLRRKLGPLGSLIGERFGRLEQAILRESDAVVPIASDFNGVLARWGVPGDRITAIENWSPLDEVPMRPRKNAWASALGLVDQPVLLYAGTLGRKHDPHVLVALASRLPDAQVVVVADGVGADQLRRDRTLPPNLHLLPLQEAETVQLVLASADVLVALLEPDAHAFSVPSKVLTYLAAGRPILAAMPADNLAARIVRDNGAGIVVEPTDTNGAVRAAHRLLADPSLRELYGSAGRAYAEKNFDAEDKADAFESVLTRIARRSHTAPGATADTSQAARAQ